MDSVKRGRCGAGGKLIKLEEVQCLVPFQRVSCEVKVVDVDSVMEVSGGKKKQDVLVGDSTGVARVTVWESEIGKLKEGESYKLTGMMVREFKGKKFLSTSKYKSAFESIATLEWWKRERKTVKAAVPMMIGPPNFAMCVWLGCS